MKNCLIKKCLILVIIGMFLIVNIIPSLSGISIKNQDSIGNNLSITKFSTLATTLYVGGSGPENYTKIQDAINDAQVGDTVYIYDDLAPYFENLVVIKAISIIGENRDTVIINGNNVGDVIHVTADSVIINYITATNSGSGSQDAGIEIDNALYCRIKNCRFISQSIGMFLNGADGNYIENNICSSNNLYGAYLLNSDYNILSSNICSENDIGVFLDSSDSNMVRYNQCLNNNIAGINASNNCDGFTMLGNVCKNSNTGIFVGSGYDIIIKINECNDSSIGFFIYDSYNIQAENNTCFNNNNFGFYLFNSSNCLISYSNCMNNNYGILISSSNNNDIINNVFSGGFYGIYIDFSSDLDIKNNNCSGNNYGIYIDGSNGNSLLYNNCSNSVEDGVHLIFSTYNLISFTGCLNCNNGIYIDRSNNNNIYNNNCTNGVYGIYATLSDNCNFNYNFCSGNTYGIYIESTNDIDLNYNNCSENNNGIYVISAGSYDVKNNICYNNIISGIYFYNSSNIIISSNDCMNNNININLSTGDNNTFTGNSCKNGVYGIYVYSYDSVIYLNNCNNNDYGIFAESSNNLDILENNCSGNNVGFYITSSSGNEIGNNSCFGNNADGIILLDFDNSVITGNNIVSNIGNGISIDSSINNNIYGNIFSNNGYDGIILVSSDNLDIYENTISNNADDGLSFESCNNLDIYENTLSNNADDGLSFITSNYNNISDNTISDNNDGVVISNSLNYLISENWIMDNLNGLEIDTSSNISTYNNFFSNTNNAYDNGNNTWNTTIIPGINIIGGAYLGGNYWADYDGEDLDLDGIGDTNLPYTSFGLIQNGGDFLPLVNIPPFEPSNPYPPDGATNTGTNIVLTWSGGDQDPGDTVTYDVYFDLNYPPTDHVSENQTGTFYNTGQINPSANYFWQIIAWDSVGASTSGPIWSFNTSDNSPPNAPIISGRKSGVPGRTYKYAFIANDPDGNDVFFSVLWGDGEVDEWVGPIKSNHALVLNHTYKYTSTYTISARAKDVNGAKSPWSTYEVNIPRNRFFINSFIYQFLEKFFPIFRHLLRIINIF